MAPHTLNHAGFWVRFYVFILDLIFTFSLLYIIFDVFLTSNNKSFLVTVAKVCFPGFYFLS